MDKELELISKYQEPFPEEIVNVMEVMKQDKEAHITQDYFDNVSGKEKQRIGKLMFYRFGIDLSNNGI